LEPKIEPKLNWYNNLRSRLSYNQRNILVYIYHIRLYI
jgi:hypothetical protein